MPGKESETRSLFVDPGLRACGTAIFRGTGAEARLERAGLPQGLSVQAANMNRPAERSHVLKTMAEAVTKWAGPLAPDSLFIELPQVYARGHQVAAKRNTDPNDLIHLAAIVGAIAVACWCRTTIKLPAEWKGTMQKHIMHERALVILTDEEKAVIPLAPRTRKQNHNTMDAVCMGLATFGRLRTVV